MNKLARDIHRLCDHEFDLCIIGAGIFGVCAAWDAALRGLKVVIIEKGDFGGATSANHFKMVHGGIRYLQHADIARIKESSRERTALLRVAPHLVKPLPILIPTLGHGRKGKVFLWLGLTIYDFLTLGRNKHIKKERHIPWNKCLSKKETIKLFPDLNHKKLTGSAVFCDGQIYNPSRLALSFLRSATEKGTSAANYIEAVGFINKENKICGVYAKDLFTGAELQIRAKHILNTAGPWAHRILKQSLGITLSTPPSFSRDLAFVINRPFKSNHALACSTQSSDSDAVLNRGGRHLFLVPWRDYTLVGVWHKIFEKPPEAITAPADEIQIFVDEINLAYPGINITLAEVSRINTGLTLFGDESEQQSELMSFGKRSRLIDHQKEHNLIGLTTLIGVRATTARGLAEKAIDQIAPKIGNIANSCQSETKPIYGGNFKSIEGLKEEIKKDCLQLDEKTRDALLQNYGSQYSNVLNYGKNNSELLIPFKNSTVLKAEILHGIREEMAHNLEDLVFRRTDLATGVCPDDDVLSECAQFAANVLDWDESRIELEINAVKKSFPHPSWHKA